MRTTQPASSRTDLLELGDGPFVFSGRPPVCRGSLVLGTTAKEGLRVRAIQTGHAADAHWAPLGFGQIKVQSRLVPGAWNVVTAHFEIDRRTAPGIYKTSIACGKKPRQVVVHVEENPQFRISPPRVELCGVGGDRLSQTLVIHNLGNVPHTLEPVATVWLEERDWVGRTLVYMLRESSADEKHQAFLDRLLGELRKSMLPAVRVALECDSPEIRPGDTRVVDMALTLPSEGMQKGRTYLGFIKMLGERLWFEVACQGSLKSKKRRAQ